MLRIDTKLTRDTKKSETADVEKNERRTEFVETELFEIEVIDENMSSRLRKSEIKD